SFRIPTAGGKLHDRNVEESWALLEDLTLYENESWNDPRDFAKPAKAISLPQDVPSTSDRHLIDERRNRQDYEPTPTSLKNFYSEAGDDVTDYT
ncbi:hypothetical protein Tco_0050062, partial [Tanacetum coccineum]